jgi:hypothetical protein
MAPRTGRPPVDPAVRFDRKVNFDGPVPDGFEDPCWLWTGAPSENGYAQFWPGGRTCPKAHGVHRWNYERFVGPIPPGFEVDHLCGVLLCVNPAHLEAVPGAVNNARSTSPSAENARLVMCQRGLHELAGENLMPSYLRRGQRVCRPCRAEAQRDKRRRQRERIKS